MNQGMFSHTMSTYYSHARTKLYLWRRSSLLEHGARLVGGESRSPSTEYHIECSNDRYYAFNAPVFILDSWCAYAATACRCFCIDRCNASWREWVETFNESIFVRTISLERLLDDEDVPAFIHLRQRRARTLYRVPGTGYKVGAKVKKPHLERRLPVAPRGCWCCGMYNYCCIFVFRHMDRYHRATLMMITTAMTRRKQFPPLARATPTSTRTSYTHAHTLLHPALAHILVNTCYFAFLLSGLGW